jgi:hypothetical protein
MSLSSEERAYNLEKCRVASPKLAVLSRNIERMIIVLDAGRLMSTCMAATTGSLKMTCLPRQSDSGGQ